MSETKRQFSLTRAASQWSGGESQFPDFPIAARNHQPTNTSNAKHNAL
jgi:hypothetical protein